MSGNKLLSVVGHTRLDFSLQGAFECRDDLHLERVCCAKEVRVNCSSISIHAILS